MKWRDRLALWCLRILTPDGIGGTPGTPSTPFRLWIDNGESTPDEPKLVMRARVDETDQTILSLVFDPDTVVEFWSTVVRDLRAWADAERERTGPKG